MRRNLNEHICLWQVDAGIANFGHKNSRDLIAAEFIEDVRALAVGCGAVDEVSVQTCRILSQCEDVIGEYNDLVAPSFVVVHQKLARAELRGIHGIEELPFGVPVQPYVVRHEVLRHGAPHLSAVHTGDVAISCQVLPVGFVDFGANQKIQVADALVLSYKSGRQSQLAVRFHYSEHLSEHCGGHHMHLVHQQQPPLSVGDGVDHALRLRAALPRKRHHRVGGDGDVAKTHKGLSLLAGDASDLRLCAAGPHEELVPPLIDRHRGVNEA